MAPANLSSKKAISFWVKGDDRPYCVMVFSRSGGFPPKTAPFQAASEWRKVTLPFSSFNTDGHDLMGIFIRAWSTPGHFNLVLDNVRLE